MLVYCSGTVENVGSGMRVVLASPFRPLADPQNPRNAHQKKMIQLGSKELNAVSTTKQTELKVKSQLSHRQGMILRIDFSKAQMKHNKTTRPCIQWVGIVLKRRNTDGQGIFIMVSHVRGGQSKFL